MTFEVTFILQGYRFWHFKSKSRQARSKLVREHKPDLISNLYDTNQGPQANHSICIYSKASLLSYPYKC